VGGGIGQVGARVANLLGLAAAVSLGVARSHGLVLWARDGMYGVSVGRISGGAAVPGANRLRRSFW